MDYKEKLSIEEIPVLSDLQPKEIAKLLIDIKDFETAEQIYPVGSEFIESEGTGGKIDELLRPSYLYGSYQMGFVPLKSPDSPSSLQVTNISSLNADEKLKGKSINIFLDRLHIYNYPGLGNRKKVMFLFNAKNHTKEKKSKEYRTESLTFSQVYDVVEGASAGIVGQPVFMGIRVGDMGVNLEFDTINVNSDGNETILKVFESDTFKSGLSLLETVQPVIKPFADITMGAINMLMESSKNMKVQSVKMGLDFIPAPFAAPLMQGNYIIAQVPEQDSIDWADWKFNSMKGFFENIKTGQSDLPYNYFVFRISL